MLRKRNKNITLALADAERIVSEAEKMNRLEKVLKKFNISYTKSVGGAELKFSLIHDHYSIEDHKYVEIKVEYTLFDFDNECQICRVDMLCKEKNEREIHYVTYDEFITTVILDSVERETK